MDPQSISPGFSPRPTSLEQFRVKPKKLKIHPMERALLWVISLHLVFLPWALGGMRVWAQWISLGFGAVSLVLALFPRNYSEEETGSEAFRLVMWPKLVNFPLFWLGLAMLAYVAIQTWNPAWVYVTDHKSWWMQRVTSTPWLPAGVSGVPFAMWGPWRMFIIYAATWMTVCAVWVGFTRRRTVRTLLIVVAANGLALTGLGLAQKLLPNGRMFWFFESPSPTFFASFIYKNHGGNYLNLVLAVTCGLAAWYYLRGLRRLEKSNPSGVFAFFAMCIAIAIVVSYARGATVAMLAFLGCCVGAFVVHQLLMKNTTRKPVVAVMLLLVFGVFLKTGLNALNSREAWTRLTEGITEKDSSLESRRVAREATFDMVKANWVRGAGAGSFRFLFPLYQQNYPSIYVEGRTRMFWEHAHNDVMEIIAEQGVAGLVILSASLLYVLGALVRGRFWRNPLSGCIVLGAAFTIFQAWWDFPFHCTAVFTLWWVLLASAVLWTRFEAQGAPA
ncbi:MAG: O-antigen ligase family protein [Verrucomicrobia bacterium]|nr:O-antigen ligase family protein [Verrucomicrobiota bacterium]